MILRNSQANQIHDHDWMKEPLSMIL